MRRSTSLRLAFALASPWLAGCGESGSALLPADGGADRASSSDAGSPLAARAGFQEIEPVHFTLDGASLVSETGRLWTVFQPATSDPEHQPLFVFFNGGPGDSTTEGLFAGNTASETVDPLFTDGGAIAPSPRPWTTLGNLLYVDARQTGFSYDITGDPADAEARRAGFSSSSFGGAFDAADFVRVVLRFLDASPSLQGSPVVLVGESYGGVRATAMLYDLLHSASLRDTTGSYVDVALADEIDQHFAAAFPGLMGAALPAQAAAQFGRQVLIEPMIAGSTQFEVAGQLMNQPGSPLFVLGQEIGTPYVPCDCGTSCGDAKSCQREFVTNAGRDPHDIDLTLAGQATRQATIEATLSDVHDLSLATGVAPGDIPLLSAKDRAGAYRTASTSPPPWTPSDESGLRTTLGQPAAWDWYLLDESPGVESTRIVADSLLITWGQEFLADLPYVKTFITHAALDVVIYAPAIPASLSQAYPGIVKSVDVDSSPRDGVARPGWFTVNYAPGAFGSPTPIAPQVVRFPIYALSGHQVASAEPVELEEDVAAWLSP